jgi:hypothetical protein
MSVNNFFFQRIVDVCCDVTLAHNIVHKIRDNADKIKESAKSGTEVFVQQDYRSPIRMNCGLLYAATVKSQQQ